MWQKHVKRVAEYCDDRLTEPELRAAELHLKTCAACRTTVEQFRADAELLRHLPIVPAPESVWRSIEIGLASQTDAPQPGARRWALQLAWAIVLAVFTILGAVFWYSPSTRDVRWTVTTPGRPGPADQLPEGNWLQTDASSRLRITVGSIGTVDVEPNTRVQLGVSGSTEHRLALARGKISAVISAPPRLFFVDTPSSTVVDLGCAYTMEVDETGGGRLAVTAGWASLAWMGREALVPAGAVCLTRPGTGPGTPYFEDATAALQDALRQFDFAKTGADALDTVLKESRVRDTLTLWHLLSRVDGTARVKVFDRLVALTPLPAGISREKALQLDSDTLTKWKDELAWTW
jgi:hypothetical protein